MNSFSTIQSNTSCECGTNHVKFDEPHLAEVQSEMAKLRPRVATLETIADLRQELASIATGTINRPVVITGPCHEPVEDPAEAAAASIRRNEIVVSSALAHALIIQRDRGQNTKPRSNALELSPDGHRVAAFHGDAVNARPWNMRQPNPIRLLRAAAQASHVEMRLRQAVGHHISAAHEFLNLSFEEPQLRREHSKLFTSSTDLPWIGVRNTDIDGEHFRLLQTVENPVGFKVDHKISDATIRNIARKMNPDQHPGKLVWMLRLGLANMSHAPRIVETISEQPGKPIILYDIHGSTRSDENGNRIRCVDEIIEETAALSGICKQLGVTLHGLHLETTVDDSRFECIDHAGQTPTHPGNIDPQLNPAQTIRVLAAAKELL